jgi:hypothetical protein
MDSASYGRFDRPGHAVTGDRSKTHAEKRAKRGYDYIHAVVDDHSSLVYVELLHPGPSRFRLMGSYCSSGQACMSSRCPFGLRSLVPWHARPSNGGREE